MSSPATVRPATLEDAHAIQRVARTAWHAAYDVVLGPETVDETVDEWYDPVRLRDDDIRPPDRAFLVAHRDDAVVGFGEGVPDGEDDALAHLYRLYVGPDHWREGIGRALLDRLTAVLRDREFERVGLSVMAANEDAVAFYESTGFRRVGSGYNESLEITEWRYEKSL